MSDFWAMQQKKHRLSHSFPVIFLISSLSLLAMNHEQLDFYDFETDPKDVLRSLLQALKPGSRGKTPMRA